MIQKKLLLATLGLSPGVVTGAYFSLTRQGEIIDKVVTVTTSNPAAGQCEKLIKETLEGAEPASFYKPHRVIGQTELKNAQVTERLTNHILRQLEDHGHTHEIHLVLTGGRTSMAAAAMLAVQKYLFQRPQRAEGLHLYHLEVLDETIEEDGRISRLATKRKADRQFFMDPPETLIALVEIPVLVQKDDPVALWARLFEFACGAYLLEHEEVENLRYSFHPDFLRDQKGLGEVDVYAERPVANPAEPIDHFDMVKLRNLLVQAFDIAELKRLCFDLNVDHEEFAPHPKSAFAQEVILYFQRFGLIQDLIAYCEVERRKYPWQSALTLQQVLLVECKLRTGDDPTHKPVTIGEVRRLANKVNAVHEQTQRPVIGWLMSNTPVAEKDAITLSAELGINLFCTSLSAKWKERGQVDWGIKSLEAIREWG